MPARMTAAVTQIRHRDHVGMGVSGSCFRVLPIRIRTISGGAMAAGEGTEQG
jgi:hypothetical protein